MDYHLHDVNGAELTLLIRIFNQKTPILFVTGETALSQKLILIMGAQGVIKKGTVPDNT